MLSSKSKSIKSPRDEEPALNSPITSFRSYTIDTAGGEGLIEAAELGAEAGDAAAGAVEEATGAGSGAAVEIEIPEMGAPGLAQAARPRV